MHRIYKIGADMHSLQVKWRGGYTRKVIRSLPIVIQLTYHVVCGYVCWCKEGYVGDKTEAVYRHLCLDCIASQQ